MAFPYQKILCPIDFDDNSVDALEHAAEISRHMNSKLAVLHVIPMVVATGEVPLPPALYEDQREAAKAKLADIAKEKLAGTQHELMVYAGDVIGSILEVEHKFQPDLLVMATHGRKGLARLFLGSIAELVLRKADCPVLTIREEAHRQPEQHSRAALPSET